MDSSLLQTWWFPWRHCLERLRKIGEAYGVSPAIESLNATVLVEIPVFKGRIPLGFAPMRHPVKGEISNEINIKAGLFFISDSWARPYTVKVPAG
jgi:hypothetical protein